MSIVKRTKLQPPKLASAPQLQQSLTLSLHFSQLTHPYSLHQIRRMDARILCQLIAAMLDSDTSLVKPLEIIDMPNYDSSPTLSPAVSIAPTSPSFDGSLRPRLRGSLSVSNLPRAGMYPWLAVMHLAQPLVW